MKDMTAREGDAAGAGARQLRLTPVEPIQCRVGYPVQLWPPMS